MSNVFFCVWGGVCVGLVFLFLFCFVFLFVCFVFVLFCFVLFFVLFRFVLFCFVLFCFVFFWHGQAARVFLGIWLLRELEPFFMINWFYVETYLNWRKLIYILKLNFQNWPVGGLFSPNIWYIFLSNDLVDLKDTKVVQKFPPPKNYQTCGIGIEATTTGFQQDSQYNHRCVRSNWQKPKP